MPDRIAFRMKLHPGQAAEYEKRHDEIFPELVTALRDAGHFGLFDLARPREQPPVRDSDPRRRSHAWRPCPTRDHEALVGASCAISWTAIPDNSPVQVPLKQVFYLP